MFENGADLVYPGLKVWSSLNSVADHKVIRRPSQAGTRPGGRTEEATVLSELAVFAASTIEPDVHRTAITSRLTYDAGPDARNRKAARFRNFVTAFHAVRLALAPWHARPRPHHFVRDGVVDLILHSSVWSPPVRHRHHPVSILSEGLQIGTATTVSKPVRAQRN